MRHRQEESSPTEPATASNLCRWQNYGLVAGAHMAMLLPPTFSPCCNIFPLFPPIFFHFLFNHIIIVSTA